MDPGACERGAVYLPSGYPVRVPNEFLMSQPVAAVEQLRNCFGATYSAACLVSISAVRSRPTTSLCSLVPLSS
jgi:hypothetical protein